MQPKTVTDTNSKIDGLKEVSLDQIKPKAYEFRDKEVVESDDFQELFLSIKIHGVLQPVTLREMNDNTTKYQIIDGGRRYNACRMLGLETIPALIRKDKKDSTKQDLVWSYVQNALSKQLTDIEKAKAIQAIYAKHGYDIDTALQHLNNLRNNKYANQALKVPQEFIDLASSVGRANSTQWFLLKLLKDVPPILLRYAEEAGLDSTKKQMLTYPAIRKDPRLQKAVINMIKDLPKDSARQLVHNIETGAYKFTGTGFKVLGDDSEKIQAKPIDFSKDAFVAFNEVTNLSKRLLYRLIEVESEEYTDEIIKNTRGNRLQRLKSLSERELNIFWNVLKPLTAALNDQMALLEQELESRNQNRNMLER